MARCLDIFAVREARASSEVCRKYRDTGRYPAGRPSGSQVNGRDLNLTFCSGHKTWGKQLDGILENCGSF